MNATIDQESLLERIGWSVCAISFFLSILAFFATLFKISAILLIVAGTLYCVQRMAERNKNESMFVATSDLVKVVFSGLGAIFFVSGDPLWGGLFLIISLLSWYLVFVYK